MFYGQNALIDFKTPKLTGNNLKIIKRVILWIVYLQLRRIFAPFKGNNAARCDMNHLASLWVCDLDVGFLSLISKLPKPDSLTWWPLINVSDNSEKILHKCKWLSWRVMPKFSIKWLIISNLVKVFAFNLHIHYHTHPTKCSYFMILANTVDSYFLL